MPTEIREMRAGDFAQLTTLWGADASVTPIEDEAALEELLRENRALSVVAFHGDVLVGALLCVRDGFTGCSNTLVTDQAGVDSELATTLLGKALVKMASQGIHRFRVTEVPEHDGPSTWEATRWINTETSAQRPDVAVSDVTDPAATAREDPAPNEAVATAPGNSAATNLSGLSGPSKVPISMPLA